MIYLNFRSLYDVAELPKPSVHFVAQNEKIGISAVQRAASGLHQAGLDVTSTFDPAVTSKTYSRVAFSFKQHESDAAAPINLFLIYNKLKTPKWLKALANLSHYTPRHPVSAAPATAGLRNETPHRPQHAKTKDLGQTWEASYLSKVEDRSLRRQASSCYASLPVIINQSF